MAAASATQMIAVWISMDMSEGIIARFRTMAIARSSVLAGHVYGGTILITVSIAALLGFALLLGYRPPGRCSGLGRAGRARRCRRLRTLLAVRRVRARRKETGHRQQPAPAADDPALLSGGFVPIESLPGWLQGIAEYQPFTPIISTIAASSPTPPREAKRHGPSVGPSRSPSSTTSGRCGSTAATPRRR
jgi:ABC-2 type transport system permease protein